MQNKMERGRLSGQRIVVTQRRDLAGPLCALLRESGAQVLEVPATRFLLPADRSRLDRALVEASSYDWIVFSNPWVVDQCLTLRTALHEDVRALAGVRLGAYGPVTAARLRAWHLKPQAVPADHKPPFIVEEMSRADDLRGRRVLLLRAEGAGLALVELLAARGARVDDVASYRTQPESEDPTGDAARFLASGAEWLVLASGLAVEHFHQRFDLPKLLARFPQLKLALTNPATKWALEKLGLNPAAVGQPNDLESLLKAMFSHSSLAIRHLPLVILPGPTLP